MTTTTPTTTVAMVGAATTSTATTDSSKWPTTVFSESEESPSNRFESGPPSSSHIPAHLILSESELPELSGIEEEVPPAPPAMSARAQAILAETLYIILPCGWRRVFYSHADDGIDLLKQNQKKKKKGRGRPKSASKEVLKNAYTIYYVTPSGRALLSAEEAAHFLHQQGIICRCFLPVADLAFNEVFNFQSNIGHLAMHTVHDFPQVAQSKCLTWCATFQSEGLLQERLRTTKQYLLRREAADPVGAYALAKTAAIFSNNNRIEDDLTSNSSGVGGELDLSPEVTSMLRSSRRELLVTEDGQVFVRDLTQDHLKHLTYELWQNGVNTDLPYTPPFLGDEEEEEDQEEDFFEFFDGPVFGKLMGKRKKKKKAGRDSGEATTSDETVMEEEEKDDQLIFFYNRPTITDPAPVKLDMSKQMMAVSLSTDGSLNFFDETPADQVAAFLQEKDLDELEDIRQFFNGGKKEDDKVTGGLSLDEDDEEEEEYSGSDTEEEEDEEFLLSDISFDGNLESEEEEEDNDDDEVFLLSDIDEEKEKKEAKVDKKKISGAKSEAGRQSPPMSTTTTTIEVVDDDLMTDDDSYDAPLPNPEDLMTEDESEEEEKDKEEQQQQKKKCSPVPADSIEPLRRITRSQGPITVKVDAATFSSPPASSSPLVQPATTSAAAAKPKASEPKPEQRQLKKRPKKRRNCIIPRDLKPKKQKVVKKEVKEEEEEDLAPSISPLLRRPSRSAATVAKESIRLTALNHF